MQVAAYQKIFNIYYLLDMANILVHHIFLKQSSKVYI